MELCCRYHYEQITCATFALLSHPALWYSHVKTMCAYFSNVVTSTPVHFALQCSYVWYTWIIFFRFSVPNLYGGSRWNTVCIAVLLTLMFSNVKQCFIPLISHPLWDCIKVSFFPLLIRVEQKQLPSWYWCINPSVTLRFKLRLLLRMKGFLICSILKCIRECVMPQGQLQVKN
jgi:hypothetical protein